MESGDTSTEGDWTSPGSIERGLTSDRSTEADLTGDFTKDVSMACGSTDIGSTGDPADDEDSPADQAKVV